MTDKERNKYVERRFLECVKEINTVRRGSGCVVGKKYWFEYIHDTND